MFTGEQAQKDHTNITCAKKTAATLTTHTETATGYSFFLLFAVCVLGTYGCTTKFDHTGEFSTDSISDTNTETSTDTDTSTGGQSDNCPNDPEKIFPGICGCGTSEIDKDRDLTPDCIDDCPNDPNKTENGICGCGIPDDDNDGDGTVNCDDRCSPDPCVNGTCANRVDSYSCTCETGWTGANCNQNIDDCNPNPCVNGTCIDGLNSHSCSCDAGWTGANCDQQINNCDFNPCVNGTCINDTSSYSCSCETGWTGPNCDRSIDDCSPNPCINGTCIDGSNSYSCSCDAGWTGTNCNQNIDDCNPDPCINGTCSDGMNSYLCDCDLGWTGTNCNQNIDDCNPDPCINGTCSDGVNSYLCDCDAGWSGTNCNDSSLGPYGLKSPDSCISPPEYDCSRAYDNMIKNDHVTCEVLPEADFCDFDSPGCEIDGCIEDFTLVYVYDAPTTIDAVRLLSDWWSKRPDLWEIWAGETTNDLPGSGATLVYSGYTAPSPWHCVTGEACTEEVPDECCPDGRGQPQDTINVGTMYPKWNIAHPTQSFLGRFWYVVVKNCHESSTLQISELEMYGQTSGE